jgi:broad specificity phosphatase PhoE
MAPQEHPDVTPDEAQSLFVIRHGDRWDYQHPEWLETAKRRGDPPLSTLGHQQARETGQFMDELLAGYTHDRITWLASPFLRTLQTSDTALNAFQKVDSRQISILPEYSVFELDGHDGQLHKDLPDMEERGCYFPRVDHTHKSLFVPELPGKPMM